MKINLIKSNTHTCVDQNLLFFYSANLVKIWIQALIDKKLEMNQSYIIQKINSIQVVVESFCCVRILLLPQLKMIKKSGKKARRLMLI